MGGVDPASITALRQAILPWYREHARALPWRQSTDAYAVLVSEIMLQQTQVDRVIPKFLALLARYPNVRALAHGRLADVLRVWSGLGYNSRAKRLWECARTIETSHAGRVPRDIAALRALPGVGRYTAGAVASFAFGAREPVVDVNVRRVLTRALGAGDDAGAADVWLLAERALPRRNSGVWSQALMDVGALFCRRRPKCQLCPARRACAYAKHPLISDRAQPKSEKFVGSRRYYRGRVVRVLAGAPSLSLLALGGQVKDGFATTDLPWLRELLADLERDGLVALNARRSRAALP